MITEVKAPNNYNMRAFTIFLAGSIEMGEAEEWQNKVATLLTERVAEIDTMVPNITLLNPRRDDWDSTWIQSISNGPFNRQVQWELDGLENSDLIVFYFDANTKSPITLMELGLVAGWGAEAIVVCPNGFWRKGNVDIVCKRFNLTQCDTIEQLVDNIIKTINQGGLR